MTRDGRDDGIVEQGRSSEVVERLRVPVLLRGGASRC